VIALVIDTETTGFALNDVPASDPRQARVLQIGASLLDDDKEVGCFYSKLYPDSWPLIQPGAEAKHHITLEQCERTGLAQKAMVAVINDWLAVADVVVAHNYKFDSRMMAIEFELQGLSFSPLKSYCTMEAMTPVCGLKKTDGKPKWPKLEEALDKCYMGATIDNAHDALADVRGCAKVFKWLVASGFYQV